MFRKIAIAMFGDGSARANSRASEEEPVNTPMVSTRGASTFAFPRTGNLGVQRNPGAGYTSALVQFQEYPENVWQGWGGVAVKRYMRPYEPLTVQQQNTPVVSGGSGIIHGSFYGAPLIDTSGGTVG